MQFVGVIDHLGLVSALSRHDKRLTSSFSHVIVDEAQDFGTLELSLIRRLDPVLKVMVLAAVCGLGERRDGA